MNIIQDIPNIISPYENNFLKVESNTTTAIMKVSCPIYPDNITSAYGTEVFTTHTYNLAKPTDSVYEINIKDIAKPFFNDFNDNFNHSTQALPDITSFKSLNIEITSDSQTITKNLLCLKHRRGKYDKPYNDFPVLLEYNEDDFKPKPYHQKLYYEDNNKFLSHNSNLLADNFYFSSNDQLDNPNGLKVVPIIEGLPFSISFFEDNQVKRDIGDWKRIKVNSTTEGIYLKWFNSLGGWSYWLFECNNHHKKKITTKSKYYPKNNETYVVKTSEVTYEVASIVQYKYIDWVTSVLHSPCVYFHIGENNWQKVEIKTNNLKTNVDNKTQLIEFKIKVLDFPNV